MYCGEDYRSQVGGYITLSSKKKSRRVRIALIRQRYSDCPIADIEFQISIPGYRTISHSFVLANRNKSAQYARLRTQLDTNKASIIRELKEAMKQIKKRIAFLLKNGNNIEMESFDSILREVCLK